MNCQLSCQLSGVIASRRFSRKPRSDSVSRVPPTPRKVRPDLAATQTASAVSRSQVRYDSNSWCSVRSVNRRITSRASTSVSGTSWVTSRWLGAMLWIPEPSSALKNLKISWTRRESCRDAAPCDSWVTPVTSSSKAPIPSTGSTAIAAATTLIGNSVRTVHSTCENDSLIGTSPTHQAITETAVPSGAQL